MSRIGRLASVATLGLLMGPGLAGAQQSEEQLLQRLDSMRPLLEEATEALEAYQRQVQRSQRQAAEAAAELDTLRVGLMTIVTPVEQVETARELFTEVWEEHYADITESPGVEREMFTFQWANEHVPIHLVEHTQHRVVYRRFVRRERVVHQIRAAIGVSINFDLSALRTDVARWVQGNAHQEHDAEAIYRKLATTSSTATRGCMEGEVEACVLALGLVEEDDRDHLGLWYQPEERQALMASRPQIGARRNSAEDWDACVQHDDIPACDRLFLYTPPTSWAPLWGQERASLLSLALDRGGRGAWARLVEDPSMPVAEALVYASGMDLETLVMEWRAWVVEGRPEVYSGLIPKSGMALVWTLVFAAFAMRSTRWRLG